MLQQSRINSIELSSLPPLSLYIHIPWCIKKCPYCDFNSHVYKAGELPEDEYIDALVLDLEQSLPDIWGRRVQSIFIGGGTPSLFSDKAIRRLINTIRSLVSLSPFAEITMEANPGVLDINYLAGYANSGVNRLSFGIQSFNDKHLTSLGRVHTAKEAKRAIKYAKEYFTNINLDIIYGIPEQTIASATTDIQIACEFGVEHISAYNLTLEPNTYFYNNVPDNLPDNDTCYAMQDEINKVLDNAGFKHYEVSAYARDGLYSQHNINYWQFGDYLGIGAGAHSKLSFCNKITRQVRHKHPSKYLSSVKLNQHIMHDKVVELAELPLEFAMNAFRLREGFSGKLFVAHTGLSLSVILPQLELAKNRGFIEMSNGIIRSTELGNNFLNELLLIFTKD